MNHANDPEWRENLEDIKLHGTGNEDIHLQKNFKVSDLKTGEQPTTLNDVPA